GAASADPPGHDRGAAEEVELRLLSHAPAARWTIMASLPPHLARVVEAEYPRFPEGEMAQRRAAIETLLSQAECDHLLFCGANRFGSVVQWLTQWPVTA